MKATCRQCGCELHAGRDLSGRLAIWVDEHESDLCPSGPSAWHER